MKQEIKGIRGWLLVFVIILISSFCIGGIIPILSGELFASNFVIIQFPIIFLQGICLFLIYKKSSSTKKWVIIMLLSLILSNIFQIITIKQRISDYQMVLPFLYISTTISILWIIYFKKSKRVKTTFIKK